MRRHILAAFVVVACKAADQPPPPSSSAGAVTSPSIAAAAVPAAAGRDYLNIVGSSTVYPFATVVAEQFGKSSKFKAPKVESTGTGGGFKLFCEGVGEKYPDIVNASRPVKASEK